MTILEKVDPQRTVKNKQGNVRIEGIYEHLPDTKFYMLGF